ARFDMRRLSFTSALAPLSLVVACQQSPKAAPAADTLATRLGSHLSTGAQLDPAAPLADIGAMALTMRLAPERDRVVLSLSGYAKQGIQVVDASTGRVLQDIPQA